VKRSWLDHKFSEGGLDQPNGIVRLASVWQCSLAPTAKQETDRVVLVAHVIGGYIEVASVVHKLECALPAMPLNEVVKLSHAVTMPDELALLQSNFG